MDQSQESQKPAKISATSSMRVHFNPIVSQLRYRQRQLQDQDDTNPSFLHTAIDKSGHQNCMKNSKISTVIFPSSEKVEKVFVTISIASPAPTCQKVIFHDYYDHNFTLPIVHQIISNVPDLLKTTPLSERKQYLDNLQREGAQAGNSKQTCAHPRSTKRSKRWTPAGLVQQLASLKKFVVGEKNSKTEDTRRRRTKKQRSLDGNFKDFEHTNNQTDSLMVANIEETFVSSSPLTNLHSFNPIQNLVLVSVNTAEEESKMNDDDDISNSCIQPRRVRSKFNKINYKFPITEPTNSDTSTDELSANVEKILEEIADLDDIMKESKTSAHKSKEEEEIEELVNECCAVSSALLCLTESANSLVTPSSSTVNCHSTMSAELPPLPPACKQKRLNSALRARFFQAPSSKSECQQSRRLEPLKADRTLDCKLTELKEDLHLSRGKISRFHPNFEEMDNSLRSSIAIDRFGRNPLNRIGWESSTSSLYSESSNDQQSHQDEENRAITKQWDSIVSKAKEKLIVSSLSHNFNNEGDFFKGLPILETDLDTGASRELFKADPLHAQSNFCSNNSQRVVNPTRKSELSKEVQKNTCSMQNLNFESKSTLSPNVPNSKEERSRSMEFLDEEKQAELMPPENTLKKKNENRQVSEHELRIQRSLQRLNVPEWYKKYAAAGLSGNKPSPSPTANRDFGSGTGLAGGWSGLQSSKTASLTSLQSAGRYAGSKTQFSSSRYKGTTSACGRTSRESLMSPCSTASASPSPYFERSSFTYGMPYALSRFATSRMSCSPASISPSPSPVGGINSSTSTPISSGPSSRYGYNKTPYLGWRSQERLNSKTLYRTPSERLAADLLAQKQKVSTPTGSTGSDISIATSPKKDTASDLSLNISDTSESSNKLNRVRSSIKEVSNAIVDYVNETKPLDEGINGRASPRRGLIWLESSFVGTKPIDSPATPDTIMSKHLGTQSAAYLQSKRSSMKMDHNGDNTKDNSTTTPVRSSENSQAICTYLSRNEKKGDGSNNSSSVSSPTLDDILDSLLALRRPHKKKKVKGHKTTTVDNTTTTLVSSEPLTSTTTNKCFETPMSDWQERMNQPLDDSMYFPQDNEAFLLSNPTTTTTTTGSNNEAQTNNERVSYMQALDGDDATSANTAIKETDGANKSQRSWMDKPKEDEEDEDNSGKIAQEEFNFGTPTEIQTTMPTLIYNPLAGLNESSSNPTTPRHRRVSFDIDISDKEEKSSSRSKRDESVGGSIQCKNSKCIKTATGLEARREFKTCHNCNAYYCSRECRRMHWEKHKKVCMQSRVGQLCKQIISHVKEDSFVVSQLSTVAKRGYLAKGRGCVKLFFSSPDRAERFLTGGLPELPEPWYIPHADMLPEEMGTTFSELSESCRTYNSETRFVLYASVCIVNEVPTSGAVKWEREMISRSSKIRILLPRSYDENQPHHHAAIPAHLNPDDIDPRAFPPSNAVAVGHYEDRSVPPSGDNETLILRSVPIPASLKLNKSEDRRRREISFANIQKHLVERGVDLRRTYPDLYSKLCNYVENDEPFLPVTIYPRNSETGNQFMCVIMPESSDTSYELSSDPSNKVETINISE